MTHVHLLLTVILLQQCLFGLLWLGAARLRLARRAALHWAAAAAVVAVGLSLLLLRGQAPQWLSVGLGNFCMLLGFVALRRGAQCYARRPCTDREHTVLLILGLLCAGGSAGPDLVPFVTVFLMGGLMVLTQWRAAVEIRSALTPEFGRAAATWCAMPTAMLGVCFTARMAFGLARPENFSRYLEQPGGGMVLPAFVALVFSLLMQVNLVAMVLLRLVQRLRYQSDHDLLTGLLGRRPMMERLQEETRRQQCFGTAFAMLSIDIDHFKAINDRHGHAVGDVVLQRVAATLLKAARDVDSVARVGGEEFWVLLPGADLAGAEAVGARMLQGVRALEHPESDSLRATISIGLAVLMPGREDVQSLQRRLDQALYRAKATGRDRLQPAEPPQAAALSV